MDFQFLIAVAAEAQAIVRRRVADLVVVGDVGLGIQPALVLGRDFPVIVAILFFDSGFKLIKISVTTVKQRDNHLSESVVLGTAWTVPRIAALVRYSGIGVAKPAIDAYRESLSAKNKNDLMTCLTHFIPRSP